MKLLYTRKQFQGEISKIKDAYKKEIERLQNKINNKDYLYLEKTNKLEKENEQYKIMILEQEGCIVDLSDKIKTLTKEKRIINGAKGGLTKYAHRLEKELAEAKEKLSQRYIIKELAPQKAKNTQVMKTKSSSKTSQIIKKVVEDE